MPPSSSFATISSSQQPLSTQRERIPEAVLEMALQDWIVMGYHALVVLGVLLGHRNSSWDWALSSALLLWAGLCGALLLARSKLILTPFWRATTYRIALIGSVQASYALMRWLLPVINPSTLDAQLYQLDLDLFGFEPAVAWAPYVTGALTEWFSFAYYGYFFVVMFYLVPLVVAGTNRRALSELTLGLTVTFCIGQALYMVVPGYGPGVGLPELFEEPLPSGFFKGLVSDTVERWGAQKDIFPSIHTAVPVLLCLWSFRFRKTPWFNPEGLLRPLHTHPVLNWLRERTWLLTLLFSLNVIIATMYLRWHYLIDVVAGLALGIIGFWLSVRLGERELAARERRGQGEIWPYFSKT